MPRTPAQKITLVVVMRAEFPTEGRTQIPAKTAIGTAPTIEDAQAAVAALAAGEPWGDVQPIVESGDTGQAGICSNVAFYWTTKEVAV